MKVEILNELGISEALYGLGLSRELTNNISFKDFNDNDELFNRLIRISKVLSPKDKGHNKFLESIQVWLDITAPRYWWSQFDTYRLATKNSESTMYNIQKRDATITNFEPMELKENQEDFEKILILFNKIKDRGNLADTKKSLPEGYLQKRQVNLSYKTLRNIVIQREFHKLPEWKLFIKEILDNINYPEYLKGTI